MNEEIYSLLLREIKRLNGEIELEPIFKEYIYDHLTDQEVLEILKTDTVDSIKLPNGLNHPAVLQKTLLFLETIQKLDSWESLDYHPPPRETIDFGKLIDHILNRTR